MLLKKIEVHNLQLVLPFSILNPIRLNMSEKSLPPFDLSGPASQVAEMWRKWKRALKYCGAGKGMDNFRKKTSQLLHFARMDVLEISSKIYKILVRSQKLATMRIK